MLGPQKLPKDDQEPKKQLPRQFFDSQEAKNDASGPVLGAKSGFCENPTPAKNGGRIFKASGGSKTAENRPF